MTEAEKLEAATKASRMAAAKLRRFAARGERMPEVYAACMSIAWETLCRIDTEGRSVGAAITYLGKFLHLKAVRRVKRDHDTRYVAPGRGPRVKDRQIVSSEAVSENASVRAAEMDRIKVDELLAVIRDGDRQVVEMRAHGYSVRQIATRLGVCQQMVSKRLRRAQEAAMNRAHQPTRGD